MSQTETGLAVVLVPAPDEVRAWMSEIGRKGGKTAKSASHKAKLVANCSKARAARLARREG